ncbi:hypothetical protein CWI38_1221p0010 [Hamiltosporidium tvaerminnensis]|uniref:Uncharacterized protein n=2 Tax=Hamiltosporidium tvaerminnensis TaxID=1176355 RepID=A0A4Q9LUH1_9MICR|nr:hypothetical protein CWI38_1221p0010 [Hamiltosporidium tvaerminnensis]
MRYEYTKADLLINYVKFEDRKHHFEKILGARNYCHTPNDENLMDFYSRYIDVMIWHFRNAYSFTDLYQQIIKIMCTLNIKFNAHFISKYLKFFVLKCCLNCNSSITGYSKVMIFIVKEYPFNFLQNICSEFLCLIMNFIYHEEIIELFKNTFKLKGTNLYRWLIFLKENDFLQSLFERLEKGEEVYNTCRIILSVLNVSCMLLGNKILRIEEWKNVGFLNEISDKSMFLIELFLMQRSYRILNVLYNILALILTYKKNMKICVICMVYQKKLEQKELNFLTNLESSISFFEIMLMIKMLLSKRYTLIRVIYSLKVHVLLVEYFFKHSGHSGYHMCFFNFVRYFFMFPVGLNAKILYDILFQCCFIERIELWTREVLAKEFEKFPAVPPMTSYLIKFYELLFDLKNECEMITKNMPKTDSTKNIEDLYDNNSDTNTDYENERNLDCYVFFDSKLSFLDSEEWISLRELYFDRLNRKLKLSYSDLKEMDCYIEDCIQEPFIRYIFRVLYNDFPSCSLFDENLRNI